MTPPRETPRQIAERLEADYIDATFANEDGVGVLTAALEQHGKAERERAFDEVLALPRPIKTTWIRYRQRVLKLRKLP